MPEPDTLGTAAAFSPEAYVEVLTFDGTDLSGIDAVDSRIIECTFTDCVIGELDLSSARGTRMSFVGTRIAQLTLSRATLTRTDLRGAELGQLTGITGLKGTTVSTDQFLDLAPLLAAHLGISIQP